MSTLQLVAKKQKMTKDDTKLLKELMSTHPELKTNEKMLQDLKDHLAYESARMKRNGYWEIPK